MKFDWLRIEHLLENSVRVMLGVILVVLGIIGLFLPFLQGIAMIFLGLTLLGFKHMREKLTMIKEKIKRWLRSK